ncbi:MAG: hypothetical protein ACRC5M_03645 [Anaeroplasmataceae bacterium]
MSLHELKKGCKIVDEVILYLMRHGHSYINVDINKVDKVFSIVIKTTKCSDRIIKKMDEYINQERELEVEEYGWELMGESDAENELGIIGLLVDSLKIDNTDPEFTTFILTRIDKYSKK